MAVFNKSSLTQISGFDNPIIAGELVYNQKTYWNLALTSEDGVTPVNLTDATINAQIVRRVLSNVQDSRYGLSFDIANYTPAPTPITLTISNRNDASGSFTLIIDDNSWSLVDSDAEMAINSATGAGFSGRIKISFIASGTSPTQTPAEDNIIFLFFIVRSDAIIKI